MKRLTGIIIVMLSSILYSCNNPTSTSVPQTPQIPNPGVPFSLVGYGTSLDSTYYKEWSDSSWEEFYMDTTINSTQYSVILYSTGYENLYGPDGFAGFGQYNGDVVLFDSSLASAPDTMLEGTNYVSQTTFSYQGTNYLMTDEETLLDTTTVTVPFGTFTGCRVLQSVGTINGVLQYATVYWLAKGPSDVEQQDYTGYTIVMAYGVVNGQSWGITPGVERPGLLPVGRNAIIAKGKARIASAQPAPDIRSIAPTILRGIVR